MTESSKNAQQSYLNDLASTQNREKEAPESKLALDPRFDRYRQIYAYRTEAKYINDEVANQIVNILNSLHTATQDKRGNMLDVLLQTFLGTRPFKKDKGLFENVGYAFGNHPILDPFKATFNSTMSSARAIQLPSRLQIIRDLVLPGDPARRRRAANKLLADAISHIPDQQTRNVVNHLATRLVEAVDGVDQTDPDWGEKVAKQFTQSLVKDGLNHLIDRFGPSMTEEERHLLTHLATSPNPSFDDPQTLKLINNAALARTSLEAKRLGPIIEHASNSIISSREFSQASDVAKEAIQTYSSLRDALEKLGPEKDTYLRYSNRALTVLNELEQNKRIQNNPSAKQKVLLTRDAVLALRKKYLERGTQPASDQTFKERLQHLIHTHISAAADAIAADGDKIILDAANKLGESIHPGGGDEAKRLAALMLKYHRNDLTEDDIHEYLTHLTSGIDSSEHAYLLDHAHKVIKLSRQGPRALALHYLSESLKHEFPQEKDRISRITNKLQTLSDDPQEAQQQLRDIFRDEGENIDNPVFKKIFHFYQNVDPISIKEQSIDELHQHYRQYNHLWDEQASDLKHAIRDHELRRISTRELHQKVMARVPHKSDGEGLIRDFRSADNGDHHIQKSIDLVKEHDKQLGYAMDIGNRIRIATRDGTETEELRKAFLNLPPEVRAKAENLLNGFEQSKSGAAHELIRDLAVHAALSRSNLSAEDQHIVRKAVKGEFTKEDAYQILDNHGLKELNEKLGLRGSDRLKAEELHQLAERLEEHARHGTLLEGALEEGGKAALHYLERNPQFLHLDERQQQLIRARQNLKDELHKQVDRYGKYAPKETLAALHKSIDEEDYQALHDHATQAQKQLQDELERRVQEHLQGEKFDLDEGVKGRHLSAALQHPDIKKLAASHPLAQQLHHEYSEHLRQYHNTPIEEIPDFNPSLYKNIEPHHAISLIKQVALSHVPSAVRGHVSHGIDATIQGRHGDSVEHFGAAAVHYLPEGSTKTFTKAVIPHLANEVRAAEAGEDPKERLKSAIERLQEYKRHQLELLKEEARGQVHKAVANTKKGFVEGLKEGIKPGRAPPRFSPTNPRTGDRHVYDDTDQDTKRARDQIITDSHDAPPFEHRDEHVVRVHDHDANSTVAKDGDRLRSSRDLDEEERRSKRIKFTGSLTPQSRDVFMPLRRDIMGQGAFSSNLRPGAAPAEPAPLKQAGSNGIDAPKPHAAPTPVQGRRAAQAQVRGSGNAGDRVAPASAAPKEDSEAARKQDEAKAKRATIAADTTNLAQGAETTAQGAASDNPIAAVTGLAAVGASIFGLVNASTGENRETLPYVPDVNDTPYGAGQTIDAPEPVTASSSVGNTPIVAASQALFG